MFAGGIMVNAPLGPDRTALGRQRELANRMLPLLGFACFVLAGIDAACWFVGQSLTGSGWSPILFMLLGVIVFLLAVPCSGSARG